MSYAKVGVHSTSAISEAKNNCIEQFFEESVVSNIEVHICDG